MLLGYVYGSAGFIVSGKVFFNNKVFIVCSWLVLLLEIIPAVVTTKPSQAFHNKGWKVGAIVYKTEKTFYRYFGYIIPVFVKDIYSYGLTVLFVKGFDPACAKDLLL